MSDVMIWKNRFESLISLVEALKVELYPGSPIQIERKPLFEKLVTALEEFGRKQFDFFFDGFDWVNRGRNAKLERSTQFPPEFVFRKTIDQLSYDFSVIKRAVEQRQNPQLQEALKQADLLTFRALEPAINGINGNQETKLIPAQTTVITYFQKTPEVLVIPYAAVVLIGVPFTIANVGANLGADSNYRDYLAVPHEIGHYVFLRGKIKDSQLNSVLFQKVVQAGLGKYAHWLEEIFADVYGCYVARSAYALSSQDIQLDNLPSKLVLDDGEHPAPVVRPYISIEVLKSINNQDEKMTADSLKDYWKLKLDERGNPKAYKLRPNGNDHVAESISVSTAINNDPTSARGAIPSIVDIVLTTLKEGAFTPWSDSPVIGDSLVSSYESFAGYINNGFLKVGSQPGVPSDCLVPDSTNSLIYYLRELAVQGQGANALPGKMPSDLWRIVMDAAGWGVGGPEEDGSSKG